jgi:hypothetical protein
MLAALMNKTFLACAALLLNASICPPALGQGVTDGPYVVPAADGGLESRQLREDSGGLQSARVKPGDTITVPAVGDLPAFPVKLREPATPGQSELEIAATTPLFVVADTHGEFDILARMLRQHGVLDAQLAWKFGRGHLVVLGDMFDRGPNHTEILWLLYALEAQARQAGGGVHVLLGNHEVMVMGGDLRYLNRKYQAATPALGVRSYAELFSARSVLGQWLRSRPAVMKINRLLLAHAGISRELIQQDLGLPAVNDSLRAVLSAPPSDAAARERAELLLGPLGPLWYRGYFPEQRGFPAASDADVDAVLAHFGVDRIIIGHTRVPTITALYGGKVIAVQVYPRRDDAGTQFETLLIRGGKLLRALPDGRVELVESQQLQ